MGAFCPQVKRVLEMHHNMPDNGPKPLSLSWGLLLQMYGGQGREIGEMKYVPADLARMHMRGTKGAAMRGGSQMQTCTSCC